MQNNITVNGMVPNNGGILIGNGADGARVGQDSYQPHDKNLSKVNLNSKIEGITMDSLKRKMLNSSFPSMFSPEIETETNKILSVIQSRNPSSSSNQLNNEGNNTSFSQLNSQTLNRELNVEGFNNINMNSNSPQGVNSRLNLNFPSYYPVNSSLGLPQSQQNQQGNMMQQSNKINEDSNNITVLNGNMGVTSNSIPNSNNNNDMICFLPPITTSIQTQQQNQQQQQQQNQQQNLQQQLQQNQQQQQQNQFQSKPQLQQHQQQQQQQQQFQQLQQQQQMQFNSDLFGSFSNNSNMQFNSNMNINTNTNNNGGWNVTGMNSFGREGDRTSSQNATPNQQNSNQMNSNHVFNASQLTDSLQLLSSLTSLSAQPLTLNSLSSISSLLPSTSTNPNQSFGFNKQQQFNQSFNQRPMGQSHILSYPNKVHPVTMYHDRNLENPIDTESSMINKELIVYFVLHNVFPSDKRYMLTIHDSNVHMGSLKKSQSQHGSQQSSTSVSNSSQPIFSYGLLRARLYDNEGKNMELCQTCLKKHTKILVIRSVEQLGIHGRLAVSVNCSGNPSSSSRKLKINFEVMDIQNNSEILWDSFSPIFHIYHHRGKRILGEKRKLAILNETANVNNSDVKGDKVEVLPPKFRSKSQGKSNDQTPTSTSASALSSTPSSSSSTSDPNQNQTPLTNLLTQPTTPQPKQKLLKLEFPNLPFFKNDSVLFGHVYNYLQEITFTRSASETLDMNGNKIKNSNSGNFTGYEFLQCEAFLHKTLFVLDDIFSDEKNKNPAFKPLMKLFVEHIFTHYAMSGLAVHSNSQVKPTQSDDQSPTSASTPSLPSESKEKSTETIDFTTSQKAYCDKLVSILREVKQLGLLDVWKQLTALLWEYFYTNGSNNKHCECKTCYYSHLAWVIQYARSKGIQKSKLAEKLNQLKISTRQGKIWHPSLNGLLSKPPTFSIWFWRNIQSIGQLCREIVDQEKIFEIFKNLYSVVTITEGEVGEAIQYGQDPVKRVQFFNNFKESLSKFVDSNSVSVSQSHSSLFNMSTPTSTITSIPSPNPLGLSLPSPSLSISTITSTQSQTQNQIGQNQTPIYLTPIALLSSSNPQNQK